MSLIHHISGHIKGRQFSETLGPVVCFHGSNGAGKSTRLLAVELALRGPRSKDRRYGPGPAQVTADLGRGGVVRRELAPKHTLTINGKGGKLADVQQEIDAAVPLSPHVFDISKFISMSEENKRQALLDLAAPVPADKYAALYPQVPPLPGERAADWLGRALEAAKQERLALMGQVRDSTKTTVALSNSVRGRFESAELAQQAVLECEQAIERMRTLQATAERGRSLQAQLEQAQQTLANLTLQVAAGETMATAPIERELAESQAAAKVGIEAQRTLGNLIDATTLAGRQLAGAARTNTRALAYLAALQAATVEADAERASRVAVALGHHLEKSGFVEVASAKTKLEDLASKRSQADLDFEAARKLVAKHRPPEAILEELARAKAHNAQVERSKAQATAAERQRSQVVAQEQGLQAQLLQLAQQLDGELIPTSEELAAKRFELADLQQERVELANRQGVRQAEQRLAEQAVKAQERIAKLKVIEAELQEARDEVLRGALEPVRKAMVPFCSLMRGEFQVGDDAVLGIVRDGAWLPVECLSDSEQALFGAGLALALAGAGGSRLVLLDRLDVCDGDRASEVLAHAVDAIHRGMLDQVLVTAHTVGRQVPGVDYRLVSEKV